MTNALQPVAAADRRGRSPWLAVLAGIALCVVAMNASAQAPAAAASDAGQIDALVGPIALYPDDLIAIILPASTSPLQIVQADRYLDKRKADPKLPLDDNWDDPVKSLLNYPEVVKKMSNDLDWTSALGEAVVADQAAVLDGIQSFRRRAQAAGNLKSDDKQVVKAEKEIIIIEPADPQVIYVPQYTPSTVVVVGVAPIYGYYPAPYPSYYYPYPPGAALATGVIWGAAMGAAWSGNRYGYGGGDININRNTNINVNSSNTNINRGGAANAQGGSSWKSNKQPGQVSNSVGKGSSSARVGDSRAGAGGAGSAAGGARASTQPGGGVGAAAGGARPSTQPSGAGAGSANRAGASGGGASAGSAFANSNASGRQTHANSSRGAASRSSASSMGGRHSGGGARAGGGGGGRGGGGGGRR